MRDLPPAFRSIPSGGELCEALEEAFERHRGWVHATGVVEDVELKLASNGADVRRTFRGRFTLASCEGPLGGPYGVTLSRAVGERVEVLAGVLVRARSAGVSALCLGAGDALPRVRSDADAGGLEPPLGFGEPKLAKRPLTSAFAARVGVTPPAPDDDEAFAPERGDLVEHFAFGVSEVLSATGDRLVLRDLGGKGRVREIDIERLAVAGPVEHQGKRLFRLSRKL
ncbi:MAG TPA: hypothetical protein VGQ57_08700 [Polyangiaceae bacterium]|jgi:hypothetical protein|nr:hypothetical protein [Polyangiaceae bacterium]